MKKLCLLIIAFALSACDSAPTSSTQASSVGLPNVASELVATKKYASIQDYYQDSNNFSFKIIKPTEFSLFPELARNADTDIILDEFKYAGLDGLLLVFAKTDINEITFSIQPKIVDYPKDLKPTATVSHALKTKMTFQANRADVAVALKELGINHFDDLIEHDPTKGVIAGQSQSQAFLDIRKDNQKSWKLLNSFRTDKEVIGK